MEELAGLNGQINLFIDTVRGTVEELLNFVRSLGTNCLDRGAHNYTYEQNAFDSFF